MFVTSGELITSEFCFCCEIYRMAHRHVTSPDVASPSSGEISYNWCFCPSCSVAASELAHVAQQEAWEVLQRVASKLRYGTDGLRVGKYHQVPIIVSSLKEFDALFARFLALRVTHAVRKPKDMLTFKGSTSVKKVRYGKWSIGEPG